MNEIRYSFLRHIGAGLIAGLMFSLALGIIFSVKMVGINESLHDFRFAFPFSLNFIPLYLMLGIIFGLIGFLMFAGIFRRDWKSVFVSLIVFFLYGGALLSLLIYLPGVSWTGHLFGFLSGVLAASWTRSAKSDGLDVE